MLHFASKLTCPSSDNRIVENSADEKMSSSKKSKKTGADEAQPTLVEIGPRFVMTPIRIFEGSFGGATLYENPGESSRFT